MSLNTKEQDWIIDRVRLYLSYGKFVINFIENNAYATNLTVNEMLGYQNIITQWMKNNNKPTFHIQHGVFGIYDRIEKCLSTCALSEISYNQCISDYHIIWGNSFEKALLTQKPTFKEISVFGNPKYSETSIEPRKKLFVNNTFGVILTGPGPYAYETNIQLLEFANDIARQFCLKIVIKIHPSDNFDYLSLFNNRAELWVDQQNAVYQYSRMDFSLMCASTMFIECVYHNVPAFIYKSVETPQISNFIFEKTNMEFETVEDLVLLLENFKGNYDEQMQSIKAISSKYLSDSRNSSQLCSEYIERIVKSDNA